MGEDVSCETPSLEIVAVDGPAAVGKTSTAQVLAQRLGYRFLSSGLGYRALGWAVLQAGWVEGRTLPVLENMGLHFTAEDEICLDGAVVRASLYAESVSKASAALSRLAWVRKKVNGALHQAVEQLALAKEKGVVIEGRDIGTEVFPQARYKFFLHASEIQRVLRAQQRWQQLQVQAASDGDVDSVRTELQRRDSSDRQRVLAPLRVGHDAQMVDTSDLTLQQVVDTMLQNW